MRSLTLLAVLCAVGANGADRLVGGPYVVSTASRSATIGWVVETGTVNTGSDPNKLDSTVPVLRGEQVTLTGMKPGETVYYEIPASSAAGAPAEARKGHFKTPPAGRADFQFVVFGDTRTRHDLHRRVVEGIARTDPDFVLHTGDLVSDGSNTAQWPIFFEIERELLRKTLFFPVLGNHERNNKRYHEFFDIRSPYYSFNWGGAHFTLLNSDIGNVAMSAAERERFWAEQTRWMEQDLEKSRTADFRFVVMHHPPYTAHQVASHMSKEALSLVPLFEKYNVTAVFAGHDHNYQHHTKNGVEYIVTGGGGAPLAPVDQPIAGMTKKVESIEHFVTVKVQGRKAHIQALALDGRVIEDITLGQ